MTADHPFAPYVRALGRGPKLSRALDEDEAGDAMAMILAGAVEPIQLGAFLMLLRYRGEAAAELAGFVRAARATIALPDAAPVVDLDWPSYADRHRQLPWFVLAALLLAGYGMRVLMHGIEGHDQGYAPTGPALTRMGVTPSPSLAAAAERLKARNFAYVTLDRFCPRLDALFDLRPLLGLRSPVNTLARELNPFSAANMIQGVFHPDYRQRHQGVAQRLGQPRAAIFKGVGGEVQRNPGKACAVLTLAGDRDEVWPALLAKPHRWRDEALDYGRLVALWRGEADEPAALAAVTGTAAVALKLMGRAESAETAQSMAETMWGGRRKKSPPFCDDA